MNKSSRANPTLRVAPSSASTAHSQEPSKSDQPLDPEVLPKPKRRTFTAKYKARILAEADACGPGEIGALLRRFVPHLEYEEFTRCGHEPWRERHGREPFLRALLGWLSA